MEHECKGTVHKVVAGDTLYKLSKMYGVRLIDILKENPYVNVYNLQPGDEMCMRKKRGVIIRRRLERH